MAEVALKNLLRLHKPTNKHDFLMLAVHSLLTDNGFRCIGSGDERDASDECDFGQTLPPDWNTMGELYALHYRKGRSDRIYLLKAMQLGKKLSVYLMDEEESQVHDIILNVDDYVIGIDFGPFPKKVDNLDSLYSHLNQLKRHFTREVLDKFTVSENGSQQQNQKRQTESQRENISEPSNSSTQDPLRAQPRRPQVPNFQDDWVPPEGLPFGYGDSDRFPGHPGGGGMLMDPFRSGGIGSPGSFHPPRHPGDLPRGSVPPGARFDPFGPVPPGGRHPDRFGRGAGPDADHLPPPGYDDMFM